MPANLVTSKLFHKAKRQSQKTNLKDKAKQTKTTSNTFQKLERRKLIDGKCLKKQA